MVGLVFNRHKIQGNGVPRARSELGWDFVFRKLASITALYSWISTTLLTPFSDLLILNKILIGQSRGTNWGFFGTVYLERDDGASIIMLDIMSETHD